MTLVMCMLSLLICVFACAPSTCACLCTVKSQIKSSARLHVDLQPGAFQNGAAIINKSNRSANDGDHGCASRPLATQRNTHHIYLTSITVKQPHRGC